MAKDATMMITTRAAEGWWYEPVAQIQRQRQRQRQRHRVDQIQIQRQRHRVDLRLIKAGRVNQWGGKLLPR